ncbi:D-ribose ABC transporter substrate-binding protein [Acidipropionibacterium jensenii]|nr:substrate-binding domain-containing protein [Acidipropionibacterium jensenii]AZZ41123.1 D-ribose ABC transporter substrate-binding protein [Acidipropionibacterium jensenii]
MQFNKISKTMAALMVGALAVGGLAGCNRDGGAASGSSADKGTVVLAVSTQTNPFFVQLVNGAKAEAKAKGVTLQVQDASDDAATQANQISNAISTGAKVVVVNPTDSDAVAPSVKALNKAKIPVIAVDRSSSSGTVDSFIASDNVAGGAQAAKELATSMGEKGDVIQLQGTPGTSASRDRGKGFTQEIAKYPNIKVVAKQTANFDRSKALDVTTNLVQAHQGVTGLFAENDEMALGAISALGSKAGKSVKVIGFDGTADGLKAVAAGTMGASIAQQPALLGKTAVDQAADLLAGKKVPTTTPMKVVTVTKSNVKDYQ